jgi:hypothetical protein
MEARVKEGGRQARVCPSLPNNRHPLGPQAVACDGVKFFLVVIPKL